MRIMRKAGSSFSRVSSAINVWSKLVFKDRTQNNFPFLSTLSREGEDLRRSYFASDPNQPVHVAVCDHGNSSRAGVWLNPAKADVPDALKTSARHWEPVNAYAIMRYFAPHSDHFVVDLPESKRSWDRVPSSEVQAIEAVWRVLLPKETVEFPPILVEMLCLKTRLGLIS